MKSDRFTYSNVSEDTTIEDTAATLHGMHLISHTTGAVKCVIYDATTTATGTIVLSGSTSTGASKVLMFDGGLECKTGIHVDVTCTSGADSVIIFYS